MKDSLVMQLFSSLSKRSGLECKYLETASEAEVILQDSIHSFLKLFHGDTLSIVYNYRQDTQQITNIQKDTD